jgi:hypothetical protein
VLSALRAGAVVDVEGFSLRAEEGPLVPGCLYVAERNTGPWLLTVKRVDIDRGYVVPTCNTYCYDLHECVRVCEAYDVNEDVGC